MTIKILGFSTSYVCIADCSIQGSHVFKVWRNFRIAKITFKNCEKVKTKNYILNAKIILA